VVQRKRLGFNPQYHKIKKEGRKEGKEDFCAWNWAKHWRLSRSNMVLDFRKLLSSKVG
jgi:hypothetical protein